MRALGLAAVVGVTFGGGAVLLWTLTRGGVATSATQSAHNYLLDIKNSRYAQAYDQLCTPNESLEDYSARMGQASSRGHRIASFRLDAALTAASADTTASAVTGKVVFADGTSTRVAFQVEPATSSTPRCLDAPDDLAG